MRRFLGDAIDDAVDDGPSCVNLTDPNAVLFCQYAQQVGNARADYAAEQALGAAANTSQMLVDVQTIDALTVAMQQLRPSISAANVPDIGFFDQTFLDIGSWASGAINALPNAVSALPNALVDALGDVISHAGGTTLTALAPWAIGGVLLFLGLQKAETTRTYRKYVA